MTQRRLPDNVPISSVTLNKTTLNLVEGTKSTLTATVNPSNTSMSKTVVWSTSDSAIATVANTGEVTAIKAGTTKIIATSEANTSKKAECTLTVTIPAVSITGVTIGNAPASLEVGARQTLTASVSPSNTTMDKTIEWSTSDATLATVSGGIVTAIKAGTVRIVATAKADSSKKAECTITITDPPAPDEEARATQSRKSIK